MPYFTIITPSFNRAHVIDRAIKSILNQTYPDWELIIVDDGSTDNTKEILTPILADKRIKYIYQDNAGVCAARNNGASVAKGDYLIFLDSDDTVEVYWLSDFYKEIKGNNYGIVYCSIKIQYQDSTILYKDVENPYGNNKGIGSELVGSWALKKELFFEVGQYDERIKFGENSELRLRINFKDINVGIIKNYNLIYNASSNGGSQNHQNKLDSIIYVLEKHKEYYNNKKHVKKVFLQTAAVSAVRIQQTRKANDLFKLALSENRTDVKLWLQSFFTTSDFLANLIWSKSKTQIHEKN
jgi:glycosyltransferase involved in cell wall biosynthesis